MSRAFVATALLLLLLPPTPSRAHPDNPTTGERAAEQAEGERDPPLPLREWTEEFELTPSQVSELERIDAWLLRERRRLREAQGEGQLGYRALAERGKQLQDDLREKLGVVLTPDQLADIDFEALFPKKIPAILLTLRGSSQGTFASGFDEGPGDVATFSYSGSIQARFAIGRSLGLTLSVGGSSTHFDFSDATELDPLEGDPFDELHTGRVSLGLDWKITRGWTAFMTGFASATGEADAALEDSLTYGGAAGVSYAFTKNFSLGLGITIRTRLEDDPQIIPLPIIRLRLDFTDQLRLTLGVPQGLRLTYAPIQELEISLTGGFGGLLSIPDARLDDEGFAPGGVFRQTSIPIGIVVDWRPLPIFKISLEGGVIAYRKYEVDDADGHNLTEVKTDPTGYVQLSLGLTF